MRTAKKGSLTVRGISILTFAVAMLVSIAVISFLVFSNWIGSSSQIMHIMVDDLNTNLYQRIDTFIRTSEAVNRYNGTMLVYGTLDLADAVGRDRFFCERLGIPQRGNLQLWLLHGGRSVLRRQEDPGQRHGDPAQG